MYQTRASLKKKALGGKINREKFIYLLANEFYSAMRQPGYPDVIGGQADIQGQTSANLANLSYDPINYRHLKKNCVDDIFLELITYPETHLILNGIAGLANLCLDDRFHERIIESNGISLIRKLLKHQDDSIKINAVACLYFLIAPDTKQSICTPFVKSYLDQFRLSQNICLANLAAFFIADHFNKKDAVSSTARSYPSDGSSTSDTGAAQS